MRTEGSLNKGERSMTNKYAVITTINPPGKFLENFFETIGSDYRLIVVGDEKTPSGWDRENVDFLSLEHQQDEFFDLSALMPRNHYSRKNIGYLYAIRAGAEKILETDDDTFFYPDALQLIDESCGVFDLKCDGWVNVYRHFYRDLLWPRGLPLDKIRSFGNIERSNGKKETSFPVQQFVIDGDPDVDAIQRLVHPGEYYAHKERVKIVLSGGAYTTFNTQCTLYDRDAYHLLYLPHHCSFRMTDIWRSLVAQVVLHHFDCALLYRSPISFQERNDHCLMDDFRQEVDGYLHNDTILWKLIDHAKEVSSACPIKLAEKLWKKLVDDFYVSKEEYELIEEWFDEFSAARLGNL